MQSLVSKVVPARYTAYYLAPQCDRLSICYRDGATLVNMASVAHNSMCLDDDDKILNHLNHEQLLLGKRCNTLALLTVYTALNMADKRDECTIVFLESIEKRLRTNYQDCNSAKISNEDREDIAMLVAKHLGKGPEFLEKRAKRLGGHHSNLSGLPSWQRR